MTGIDQDRQVRAAFRVFAQSMTPYIQAPGAALAQREGWRRVRTRRLVVAAVTAVAVLIPAGVVALVRGGGSTSLPMPPATSTPTVSPSATPTATPSPTAPPTLEAQPTPGPGELLNTTLTLSWKNAQANELCSGAVTIVDGHAHLRVESTMSFDVDRDGDLEIVAHVHCLIGQVGPQKLLAVELGPAGPTIVGTVLAIDLVRNSDDRALWDPEAIRGYVGLSDGSIRVDVAHAATCCAIPAQSAVVQQRDYRWTGSDFAQVAGPTTFVADRAVADIEVTVPTLVFGAPVDGFRSGTLTVQVRNNGPQPAADVSVYIEHFLDIETPAGGDWSRCESPQNGFTRSAVCTVGDLAPGQSVTLTLPMRRDVVREAGESWSLAAHTGRVEARAGAFYYVPSVEFDVDVA